VPGTAFGLPRTGSPGAVGHLLLPTYPFRGADTAGDSRSGWGIAAFQLCGRVTTLQLRRMWRARIKRARIKPLQSWRDFAAACPEPPRSPRVGRHSWKVLWMVVLRRRVRFPAAAERQRSPLHPLCQFRHSRYLSKQKTSEIYIGSFTCDNCSSCS